jgi:hypothetical protein
VVEAGHLDGAREPAGQQGEGGRDVVVAVRHRGGLAHGIGLGNGSTLTSTPGRLYGASSFPTRIHVLGDDCRAATPAPM